MFCILKSFTVKSLKTSYIRILFNNKENESGSSWSSLHVPKPGRDRVTWRQEGLFWRHSPQGGRASCQMFILMKPSQANRPNVCSFRKTAPQRVPQPGGEMHEERNSHQSLLVGPTRTMKVPSGRIPRFSARLLICDACTRL